MAGRKPRVSDSEILQVLADAADPVHSAKEISESLDIGERGTYNRLQDLEGKALVKSKKIGQGRAWWLTDRGRAYIAGEPDDDDLEGDE